MISNTKHFIFACITLLSISSINAQFLSGGDGWFSGRFGVTAGATNYSTDASFLFSKSGTGFKVGLVGTAQFSDRLELFMEMNYARHGVSFIGRETELATPEDIKFNLESFNIPFVLDYTFLTVDDEWYFGASAGPSVSFVYNYTLADDSKSDYVLDPLYTSPSSLEFDTQKEQISFNAFLAFGLSGEYRKFMATFRYFKGITDPYRNINLISPVVELKGKDNYFEFSLVYLFEEKL